MTESNKNWVDRLARNIFTFVTDQKRDALYHMAKSNPQLALILGFGAVAIAIAVWPSTVAWALTNPSGTLTAIATVTIAIYTRTLYTATNRMQETVKRQADQIDREFLAAHPPMLTIRIDTPNVIITRSGDDPRYTVIGNLSFRVINTGGSDATVKVIHVTHWCKWHGDSFSPWTPPGFSPEARHLGPGDKIQIPYQANLPFQTLDTENMDRPPDELLLFGVVNYADSKGRPRERGFCRIFDIARPGAWHVFNDAYEYDE